MDVDLNVDSTMVELLSDSDKVLSRNFLEENIIVVIIQICVTFMI